MEPRRPSVHDEMAVSGRVSPPPGLSQTQLRTAESRSPPPGQSSEGASPTLTPLGPLHVRSSGAGVRWSTPLAAALAAGLVAVALWPRGTALPEGLERMPRGGTHPAERAAAEGLVAAALRVSTDQEAQSPFSASAAREGYAHPGGKPDDITALVATVSPGGLRIGAACRALEPRRTLAAGAAADCGADAYFVLPPEADAEGWGALGVADGVGGWLLAGVDPALFAWTLMAACRAFLRRRRLRRARGGPKEALIHGYSELVRGRAVRAGGSTAVIAQLIELGGGPGRALRVANLGDSGVIVARSDGVVQWHSQVQMHAFNAPFQLAVGGEAGQGDPPTAADEYTISVGNGDVIVVVTDGVLDNLPVEQVARIAAEGVRNATRAAPSAG